MLYESLQVFKIKTPLPFYFQIWKDEPMQLSGRGRHVQAASQAKPIAAWPGTVAQIIVLVACAPHLQVVQTS